MNPPNNLTNPRNFSSAKELDAYLEAQGVTEAGRKAIVSETACFRHEMRTLAVKAMTREYFKHIHLTAYLLDVALVLIADIAGIGGSDGVEGLASERHPALDCAGSGRKHAKDGAAWDSAIKNALESIFQSYPDGSRFYLAPSTCMKVEVNQLGGENIVSREIALHRVNEQGFVDPSDETCYDFSDAPAWGLTLAREGLRLSMGLAPWIPKLQELSPLLTIGGYEQTPENPDDNIGYILADACGWSHCVSYYSRLVEKQRALIESGNAALAALSGQERLEHDRKDDETRAARKADLVHAREEAYVACKGGLTLARESTYAAARGEVFDVTVRRGPSTTQPVESAQGEIAGA